MFRTQTIKQLSAWHQHGNLFVEEYNRALLSARR